MSNQIKIITTPFVLNVSVNCYLVRTGDGFVLIDTGRAGQRAAVEKELERAGCKPGNLRLIVLTHGDFDHCGSAAYFGAKYGAQIALHSDDRGKVEHGDMFWNRKQPNVVMRTLFGLIFRLSAADRFTPDLYLAEDSDLSQYGFDAAVIRLPGHSKGSVGFLTADGDLFCGDLLANTDKPGLWTIMDDPAAAHASLDKLKGRAINTVYPGHGRPFPMAQLITDHP